LLGDINEAFSPMAFVNGDPVNNIDIDGLYASNTFDGKPLGDGGGRVPGAPEEEKPKPKAPSMDFATWGAFQFARLEAAISSNGPAYSEMGPTRRALNDFANSSFMKTANEWNPLYQGVKALSGTLTGKDVYGKSMGGGDIATSTFAALPFAKVTKLLPRGLVANAGGKIISFTTQETETFYRVYSKNSKGGAFLTKVAPKSASFAREGLALPSTNTARFIQKVTIPEGVILQRSRALPAFGKRGGLEQFQILNYDPRIIFNKGIKLN
jgi:hypothetical protein